MMQQLRTGTLPEITVDAVSAAANAAASGGYVTTVQVERTVGATDQARAAAARAGVDATIQILGAAIRVRFSPR